MTRSPKNHPINIQIGQRLHQRRLLLGLSQTDLGQRMQLTFQQVQKYERGTNALSAVRLVQAAEALGVSARLDAGDLGKAIDLLIAGGGIADGGAVDTRRT